MLFGLIITPWVTIRPVQAIRRTINEKPVDVLVMAVMDLLTGLLIGLMAAYPLSLLSHPLGSILPPAPAVFSGYMGLTIATIRARELWAVLGEYIRPHSNGITMNMGGGR